MREKRGLAIYIGSANV